jgi:hypothetical protein
LDVFCQINDALLEQRYKCVVCIGGFWSGVLNYHVAVNRDACAALAKKTHKHTERLIVALLQTYRK